MSTIYRSGLLCLLLLLAMPGYGASIFYEPRTDDQIVTDAQWLEIWQGLKADGFEQVIVRWTRFDEEDFGGEGGWLNRALQGAEDSGIALVLGLQYESDYYEVLSQQNSSVYYWHYLLSRARQQQQVLLNWDLQTSAWFIPYELDDTLYRNDAMLREISFQLASFIALGYGPVHLRASSSGLLSPRVYADWLSAISEEGIRLWWQYGTNISALPAVRDAYQNALPCDVGIVYEPPRQVQSLPNCHSEAVSSLRSMAIAFEYLQ